MENGSSPAAEFTEERGREQEQLQQQQPGSQSTTAPSSLPELQLAQSSPTVNIHEPDEDPPSYDLHQTPDQLSVTPTTTAAATTTTTTTLPSYEYVPPAYTNQGFVCFPPPYASVVGETIQDGTVFYCRIPPPRYHGATGAAAAAAGDDDAVTIRRSAQSSSNHHGKQTFFWHVTVACLVFWVCGWVFGAVAFMLAVVASSTASSGDREAARKLGQASAITSTIGILFGVFVWGFITWSLVVMSTGTNTDVNCSHGNRPYLCDGRCYANAMHGNERTCHMMPSSCFLDKVCYFNA